MTTRQYLVPGWGYVNETAKRQFLVPGRGYFNDTTPTAASAAFSVAGVAAVSFAGTFLGTSHFSVAGVAAVTGVGKSTVQSPFSVTGVAAVAFSGSIKAQIKGYLVPGWGYVNETIPRQFLIPNWGYFGDTQITGNLFSVAGRSSASFSSGPSSFSVAGKSVVSGRSNANTHTAFSVTGASAVMGVGSSAFYTTVTYYNMDDLFNVISFRPFNPPRAIATVIGSSSVGMLSTTLFSARASVTGHSNAAFGGQVGPSTSGGQFDYSNAANSGLLPGVMQ